jgi:hypothetical protein
LRADDRIEIIHVAARLKYRDFEAIFGGGPSLVRARRPADFTKQQDDIAIVVEIYGGGEAEFNGGWGNAVIITDSDANDPDLPHPRPRANRRATILADIPVGRLLYGDAAFLVWHEDDAELRHIVEVLERL